MPQYKERDGEEDRKPGGKCGVKGGGSIEQDNVEERYIQYHSGDPG